MTIYYKVVDTCCGDRMQSIGQWPSLRLLYVLNKTTWPKIGCLYAYNNLRNAKKAAAEYRKWLPIIIIEGTGHAVRSSVKPQASGIWCNFEYFWQDVFKGVIRSTDQSFKIPMGTRLLYSFTPRRVCG